MNKDDDCLFPSYNIKAKLRENQAFEISHPGQALDHRQVTNIFYVVLGAINQQNNLFPVLFHK